MVQTQAGLFGRPGDVGRQIAVGSGKQRVVRRDGLLGDHVGAVGCQSAAFQRGSHRRLVDEAAPGRIEQDGSRLHFRQGAGVHQVEIFRRLRAVERDNVRLAQQGLQRHEPRPLRHRLFMARRDEQAHPEGLGHPAHGLTDGTVAHQAHGPAAQLRQRLVPEAEIRAALPLAVKDRRRMKPHLLGDLQQQGKGHLGHSCRGIAGNVADRDAVALCRLDVDDIVARRQNTDHFQPGAGVKHRLTDGRFVQKYDLRAADARNDLLRRGAVIDRQLPKGCQLLPAQIAGIGGIGVQNHNFHCFTNRACWPCAEPPHTRSGSPPAPPWTRYPPRASPASSRNRRRRPARRSAWPPTGSAPGA